MNAEAGALTSHERRVLDDFVSRRKVPAAVSVGVGLAGLVLLLVADVPQWVAVVTSALCGGLVGSWIEKRHLNELGGAVSKLREQAASRKAPEM